MQGDTWQRLAWWWNNSWGTDTRRDVWLEQDKLTGKFRLRWRRGQESERLCVTPNSSIVVDFLKTLLGEQKTGWMEKVYLDEHGDLWRFDRPTEKVTDD